MCHSWLGLLALALWTAGVACQQCGVAGGVTKIVGGQSVGSLEFPWYVALVTPDGSPTIEVTCGGSLITNRHVISAAHCFPRTSGVRPEQMYRAVLGLVNRCSHSHPEHVNIAKVRVHPDYNMKTLQSDISVITLDRVVSFTPVCLPPRNYQPYGPALVIGFGSTLVKSTGESQYPCTLQQAQVDIYSKRQCARSSLEPQYSNIPGTFCAGVPAGGVDSCDGDSGGPIMTVGKDGSYTVQGIVSFGEGCARKNLPGVYTKVSAYRDFIDSSVSRTDAGEGDELSSTLTPLDVTLPSPSDDPTSLSPSLLDSLLTLLLSWVYVDSPSDSSSGVSDIASPSVGGSSASSRPLSPWEYFLLQLFNPNHHRRVRPSNPWLLG